MDQPAPTRDSLLQFHQSHFEAQHPPRLSHPSLGFSAPPATRTSQSIDDVQPQYYADGTIRTLSDEQIAIFRHTEIQKLLAERRRQEAASEEAVERAVEDPVKDEQQAIKSV